MSNIIPFKFGQKDMRIIEDGAGGFEVVAKDVVEGIGAGWNGNAAIAHVPAEWKGVRSVLTPGGLQEMATLLEPGVYFYLNRSDKPDALPMQKWVAGEVLPSIRKTGAYSLPAAPAPAELSRMQILEIAMASEQARLLAETERDEAVRTKALIGSKREATAMAKASVAVREVNRLTEELGRNAKRATVIAVETALGRKLGKQDWVPLRRYCKEHGLQAEKVHDPRWGEATAWPAAAWKAVWGIDLQEVFPDTTLEPA